MLSQSIIRCSSLSERLCSWANDGMHKVGASQLVELIKLKHLTSNILPTNKTNASIILWKNGFILIFKYHISVYPRLVFEILI